MRGSEAVADIALHARCALLDAVGNDAVGDGVVDHAEAAHSRRRCWLLVKFWHFCSVEASAQPVLVRFLTALRYDKPGGFNTLRLSK